jgi:pimeloyl-ACP methyl ester carboxylesterase
MIANSPSAPGATIDKVLGAADRVKEQMRDGLQAAIVGSSFGGLVAQRFALRYPDRVSQLILADTSVPRPERAAANRRAARLFPILPARLLDAVPR